MDRIIILIIVYLIACYIWKRLIVQDIGKYIMQCYLYQV